MKSVGIRFSVLFLLFTIFASKIFSASKDLSAKHLECFSCDGFSLEEISPILEKGYTFDEIKNAIIVKKLHDNVELAAYDALVKAIIELGINSDYISESQSHDILHKYIKFAAHKVMRSSEGYMTKRGQYLNKETQINPILQKVMWIIHDRDRRLTNATYTSLTDLVYALDSHNSMVNQIIFEAWGYPLVHIHTHLNEIKNKVSFYSRLSSVIDFDLKEALKEKLSKELLVRSHFREVSYEPVYGRQMISYVTDYVGLVAIAKEDLDNFLFDNLNSQEDIDFLLENSLACEKTTVREFFQTYFQELILL